QNNENQNKDYDLDNEIENNILPNELDKGKCHEANSGYLHRRLNRGVLDFGCDNKHNDSFAILENFGNWIPLTLKPCLPKDLIYSQVDSFDKLVLSTLLMIQIAFKLAKIDLSAKAKAVLLKEKECTYFRNLLGEFL
ncbi:20989_t:CDS:2, partial [Gigaspora margarita]